jgi:hypothetical protein
MDTEQASWNFFACTLFQNLGKITDANECDLWGERVKIPPKFKGYFTSSERALKGFEV